MPDKMEKSYKVRVRNIDIGCSEHPDGFSVKWNGEVAATIKPGESATLPIYLGEHFAEHLAQHLLLKETSGENQAPPRERKDEIKNKIIEEYIDVPAKEVEKIPRGVGHVVDNDKT